MGILFSLLAWWVPFILYAWDGRPFMGILAGTVTMLSYWAGLFYRGRGK